MKQFLKLWTGELISNIGSGMTAFALSVYIYERTKSVTYVSLITLLAYMPGIILSPVGGALADRYDRRMMMIIGDLFSGLGLLYILWNINIGNKSLIPIFAGTVFSSLFTGILEPSYKATVTDVLSEEEYDRASGMIQMAGNAKYLISPALGGVILSFWGMKAILILDIMTFIITSFIIFSVRKYVNKGKRVKKSSFILQMKEGFSEITENRGIFSMVVTMFFVCFLIGIVQVLLRPLILSVSTVKTAGFMESVCAVGMLFGSLWIGVRGLKGKYVRALSVAGVISGIFMSFTGMYFDLIITGIFIFLFFITLPFINTCADVLVRLNVSDEVQGRVWGVIGFITQIGMVIAFAVSGILVDMVFEPLMSKGILTDSIGGFIGYGNRGGIGLMLMFSGIGMVLMFIIIGKNKAIKGLELGKEKVGNVS
ncbi:MFS transporter [Leptotrichia sp. OH3620_COT-345]|uniref:MFS transporter n=1 Tax=Leptotrichia sp. OH3620_COT-345 TaxID=2491048 RepID=UPI000F64854A|nr:MFS transporter [Leptotrichia sp. OH3620_COT-345]RRD39900.1 MFS transporter [Leptotrichia sp. OH3620_COT-345]